MTSTASEIGGTSARDRGVTQQSALLTFTPQAPAPPNVPRRDDADVGLDESVPGRSAFTQKSVADTVPLGVRRASGGDPYERLAAWEGTVIDVLDDRFSARLLARDDATPPLDVEVSFREIAPSDRDLLAEGAVFYWDVGYRHRPGAKVRESVLSFRRLPVWREADVVRGTHEAARLKNALGWR